ncbi:hypothetical protein M3Y95_01005900 [Aphelenchoides besseyi]|nr:hypothetical protein M3Y95_01005900 [Aphelenchoides besseyi]
MLLVSSFHRWHWIVGLVLTLVLSPIAVTADCFESTTDEVILSGSCSKANTTLFIKNPEQSLDFKLDAKKGGTLTQQQIKLAIGKCEFTGEVIYGGPSNSIRLSGNPAPSFELPANAKADSNGITFNGVQNKVATCSSKFEQAKDGYKVSIVYDSKDVILPDFKIMFENAQIYDPPIDKADWSYKGWRLWTVLGSIAAGLLIVVTIITFVVIKVLKNKRKSQFEGGCQTENKSSTAKSTVKSKSIWKKNKSKSAEKSAAKVVDKNEWLKTFVWPLEYTTEVIDMMLVRFDVPNAPIRQVLQMHPMTAAQQDAFNRWSTKHYKVCAVRNEMQLTPELYNRLMAECRVINNFVDMGKKMGLAHSKRVV